MEELVGELWHKFITHRVNNEFVEATVNLADLSAQLPLFYRAMGGCSGVILEAADKRRFHVQRNWSQKLAGSHQKFSVCWQNDQRLNLPKSISLFPDKHLNELLYFWQVAVAAKLPHITNWFGDNQQVCVDLIKNYPGLGKNYFLLANAIINQRPCIDDLQGTEKERECAIQKALLNPGQVKFLPVASGDPLPIPLWIYPSPLHVISTDVSDNIDGQSGSDNQQQTQITRKEAQRIDDQKETDGLLVFQLDALFSWTEQIELDRVQDENHDDDILSAAEDLDIITLSRKRRSGSSSIKFDMDLPAAENDDLPLGDGIFLPEWHYKKSSYINDFCLLQPFLADEVAPAAIPDHLISTAKTLKRQFSILKTDRRWQKKQINGDEIDMDAWLSIVTNPVRDLNKQDHYMTRLTDHRNLACLLLADLSMSTDCAMNQDQKVIDIIRDSVLLFAEALSQSDDQFAMYGFSSVKNKQVRYHLLKNFNETYSDVIRARILDIKPGFYTRMGAAIRQSTIVLQLPKVNQRLMLIISDGKPNDLDQYEGRYGIEDTRKAVLEAKQQGIIPFCITIDEQGNDYLPYIFGDQGYIIVNDATRLPTLLPKLYLHLTGTHR